MSTYIRNDNDIDDDKRSFEDDYINNDYQVIRNYNSNDNLTCESCGSNDVWDDNLYWGCKRCGAGNILARKDKYKSTNW